MDGTVIVVCAWLRERIRETSTRRNIAGIEKVATFARDRVCYSIMIYPSDSRSRFYREGLWRIELAVVLVPRALYDCDVSRSSRP